MRSGTRRAGVTLLGALFAVALAACGGGSGPGRHASSRVPVSSTTAPGGTGVPAPGATPSGPARAAALAAANDQLANVDRLLSQADSAASQTAPDSSQEGSAP